MINITYYTETLDNWGRTESSTKPDVIKRVLQTPDEFSDDMQFEDKEGRIYFIDDLIGQEIQVGEEIFTVTE